MIPLSARTRLFFFLHFVVLAQFHLFNISHRLQVGLDINPQRLYSVRDSDTSTILVLEGMESKVSGCLLLLLFLKLIFGS